ncbi:MAG: response regulator transcription factor [Dehalococcoidia bacterium]|nr:response regulator transcription factor [Dehalococcoidia bacterium]
MSITVLLADDHAVVRDGLRSMLEAHGDIEVIGDAANGHDAVGQAAQLCPDVAIVDIAMPGLNGIDVTRKILKLCPSAKVIILSMYSATEHILRALQAGALGYVLKESAGVEVISAIRAVHAGNRYLSEKILGMVVDDYLYQSEIVRAESPLARLSLREREILQLVVEGKSSAEIGQILHVSPKTVDTHRSRLMKKLNVSDRTGLIRFSILHGLTPLEQLDSTSTNTTA